MLPVLKSSNIPKHLATVQCLSMLPRLRLDVMDHDVEGNLRIQPSRRLMLERGGLIGLQANRRFPNQVCLFS